MHSWLKKPIFSRKYLSILLNEYEKKRIPVWKRWKTTVPVTKESKMQLEPVGLQEKKSRAQVKQGKAKHHIQEIPRFPTVRKCVCCGVKQITHAPGLFPMVLNQSFTEPPCDCCPTVLFSNL